MPVPDEAVQAAIEAVRHSMLLHDYTASPTDFRTDIRTALEAATPLLVDPIETGREAALAQWHERWCILREYLTDAVMPVAGHYLRFIDRLEQNIPVGKAPDLPHGEVMRRTAELLGFEPDNHHNALVCPYCIIPGRVTIQLEPERAERLLELLELLTPERAGSYPASNDAQALREDLRLMMERQ